MTSFKDTSQDNGKGQYPNNTFRKGLNLQTIRIASDKPLLPALTPTKLDLSRNNMLAQFTPKSDIKAIATRLLHGKNGDNDSLPSNSQPNSKITSSYLNNHTNLKTLSPFGENYSRQRQEKSAEHAYSNNYTINSEANKADTFNKAVLNGLSPNKPPLYSPRKNNLKETFSNLKGDNGVFTDKSKIGGLSYKFTYGKKGRTNSMAEEQSFDTLMQKLGKISSMRVSLPNFEPTRGSDKAYGIIKGFGICTNQGLVRNYNEDRVAVVLNITRPPNKAKTDDWPQCNFFAIYDGHGGTKCADYLRNNFHQQVVKSASFPWNPGEALREAFEIADKEFIELADKNSGPSGLYDRSGSCALVALFVEDTLYIANVGDSRAIISQKLGSERLALTRDHKPSDPQEQARIILAGGKIYQNFPLGMTGQRFDIDPASNPFKVDVPYRVIPGRLSVSRTVGDIEAKLPKYGGNPGVVISKPEITTLKITSDHDFIIMGCDGVFDKVQNDAIIQTVWDAHRSAPEKNIHEVSKLGAENIIRQAMLNRSMDNVTAVTISFAGIENDIQTLQQNLHFDRKYETINQKESFNTNSGIPVPIGGIKKQLQAENYETSSEKHIIDLKSNLFGAKITQIKDNSTKLNSHRVYASKGLVQQTPILPGIRSSSVHDIYGQIAKIPQTNNTPRNGL